MGSQVRGLVFVTGGARSGKSRFALARAEAVASGVTFIATAEALDEEMEQRIARHRAERSGPAMKGWITIEEPRDLQGALERVTTPVAIVDCLSLWVSNLMLDGRSEADILDATGCLVPRPDRLVIAVTNEVGLGIVPDNALGRAFRDVLGRVNQAVAAEASEAYLLVAGLPLRLK